MKQEVINTAVILAAGKGSRLGDMTKEMPKGFLKVGNETLIERSIRLLKAYGIENIIVGVGHKGTAYEAIQAQYDLNIYYNDEYNTTESMYTLVCAKDNIKGDFLLLESDLLYDQLALHSILECTRPNVILGSGFTESNDEVYLFAHPNGDFRYLSQDRNDRINCYAELVGISKISFDLYHKLISLPNIKKMKYEYGFNILSVMEDIYVKKEPNLIWCEIDDDHHLQRAINLVLPNITG